MSPRPVRVVDLFAGAGGMSTGLAQACQATGRSVDLLAINCWPKAIESHQANHPWARNLCSALLGAGTRRTLEESV